MSKKQRRNRIESLKAKTGKNARGAANILNREHTARAKEIRQHPFIAKLITRLHEADRRAADLMGMKPVDVMAAHAAIITARDHLADLREAAEIVQDSSLVDGYGDREILWKTWETELPKIDVRQAGEQLRKMFHNPLTEMIERQKKMFHNPLRTVSDQLKGLTKTHEHFAEIVLPGQALAEAANAMRPVTEAMGRLSAVNTLVGSKSATLAAISGHGLAAAMRPLSGMPLINPDPLGITKTLLGKNALTSLLAESPLTAAMTAASKFSVRAQMPSSLQWLIDFNDKLDLVSGRALMRRLKRDDEGTESTTHSDE